MGKIDSAKPEEIHLVIDCRVISVEIETLKDIILSFINLFCNDFDVTKIIFTGSSIPPVITSLTSTNSQVSIDRREWLLWQSINRSLPNTIGFKTSFGDYGLVSPDYSDIELEEWMFQSIAAPKVFYTYSTKFFIVRGSSFKTHPDGYGQYFAIADTIVDSGVFRGEAYSYGDKYIHGRSFLATARAKKGGSPSSWLKAGLSTHITFIVDSL